jgi:flagellar biosynthetic protein FliR
VDWLPFTVDQIQYFLLVFVRISTVIALLPIFGSPQVPPQIKVGISLLLSVVLFSSIMSLNPQFPKAFSFALFFLLVLKEAMVGLVIGFVTTFLFTAVQLAGQLIDNEMGFGFAQVADPFTEEPITVLGQFQLIIFTILFLLFNGHYFLLLAIQKSFVIVPLFTAHMPGGKESFYVTAMVANVFVLALRFAAPIYVTLILTEMALGVVARTVPQINIFFVGMPLKIFVGLWVMMIVLPSLSNLFKQTVEMLMQDIWKLLYLMA